MTEQAHLDLRVEAFERCPEETERLWLLVLAHRERLLRLSRARTASAQDAEDCVQEAMLRCVEFKNLDESRLGPFLTTVTLRLCADRYRERANEERLRRRLGPGELEAPGPEDDVCDRSEAVWLATRFGELTPRQQEIVRAREAGLSCAEVASRLQVSYVSVESSLARARSRFRDALSKTLGVLTPSAWRWQTVAVEAATVTAIAVGGIGGGTVVVAAPPAVPPVPRVSAPVVPAIRPVPRPAAPAPARVPRATAPRVVAAAPVPVSFLPSGPTDKKPRPEPIAEAGGWELGENERDDDYTTEERLEHCVRYGVQLTGGIRCRYPDET